MLFSSITFLYFFLPCVLILYLIVPTKAKNLILLLASLIFYAWGEPKYVLIMICSIFSGYIFGILIEHFRICKPGLSKLFLLCSVIVSLGLLAYFKYADFFITNFNAVTGLSIPLLRIALPIGISFYTFQILSYTIDIYRGTVNAQKNIINLGAYIALFPQLIAGPIVRYSDIENQLKHRYINMDSIASGIRLFIIGLSKKILIANPLGELCSAFSMATEQAVLFYWLYAIGFTLQIYFDFSGYSDMAIGLGRILGFDFMKNFNYPYISGSITEFWRRWHISLGNWFRDYVYIPCGGNKVAKLQHLRNIFIVWLLTGLWHGAAWNFVVWGLFFAILLVIEKQWLLSHLKNLHIFNHIYVMFFVTISFVIFNASDLGQAALYIKSMFGFGDISLISEEFIYYLRSYIVIILLAITGATPLPAKVATSMSKHKYGKKIISIIEPLMLIVLLLICTAYLVDGSFNPFLYFRF